MAHKSDNWFIENAHNTARFFTENRHISWVLLTGPYAYKIKKPLDLGFLDFTTLERRRHFCLEEVRLNRRLAPTAYLGVVPVAVGAGRLRVDGEGDVVEWAVWMRRLPDEATLGRRLASTPDAVCSRHSGWPSQNSLLTMGHSSAATLKRSGPAAPSTGHEWTRAGVSVLPWLVPAAACMLLKFNLLVSHTKQTIKVGPMKPGQTLQVVCSARWTVEKDGRVDWILEDANEMKLRTASHTNPEASFIALEWTSNSEPRPESYIIQIQASGGTAGQELGEYTLLVMLRDQNDGDSGTDAPESFEKALLLPAQEPGTYGFGECFLSGTADLYDLYKIQLRPNHSLSFKALPL